MADYLTNTEELTIVADAIRAKSGASAPLEFPQGMADAIASIASGGEKREKGTVIFDQDTKICEIRTTEPKSNFILIADTTYDSFIQHGAHKTFLIQKQKDDPFSTFIKSNYDGARMEGISYWDDKTPYILFDGKSIKIDTYNTFNGSHFLAGITYKWEAW